MIITCPSGLSGEIRKMSAKEGKLVADRRSTKGTFLADSILSGCFVKITEPGPYGFGTSSTPRWSEVIAGDRVHALIQIRALSLGAEFDFKVQCDQEGCRKTYEWSLNLHDLPFKKLPEESAFRLKNGNKHPVRINRIMRKGNKELPEPEPDWVEVDPGIGAECKLVTGYDQNKWAPLLQESNDRLIMAIRMKIVSIEGRHENDIMSFLESLDYDQLLRLRDDMDDLDGGVDTDISVVCPKCGNEQEMTLPFDKDFFFPKRMKRF